MYNSEYSKQIAKHLDSLIVVFKFTPQKYEPSQTLDSASHMFDKQNEERHELDLRQTDVIRNLLTFLSEDEHPIVEYTPVTFYVFNDGYDNHNIDDVSAAISRARDLVDFKSDTFNSFTKSEYHYYKILDHISLAFVQVSEMRRLQKLIDETEGKLAKVDIGLAEINTTQEYVEKQVSSIYPQFITILGIFTAIIVAFFGGVSLTNSLIALGIFDTIETLITIGSIAAIFILTMLFMLMTWVDHILNKNVLKVKHTEVYFTSIICLTVFSIVGMILIVTK